MYVYIFIGVSQVAQGKESACSAGDAGFNSWVEKIPWLRKWQPTPVFLPGKTHGQRSLAGYLPWGHKIVGHNLGTKQQQKYMIYICVYIHVLYTIW